jgi:hypothetical protein
MLLKRNLVVARAENYACVHDRRGRLSYYFRPRILRCAVVSFTSSYAVLGSDAPVGSNHVVLRRGHGVAACPGLRQYSCLRQRFPRR